MNCVAQKATALALGLDLGSTYIKAGLLDDQGRLTHIESSPAPTLDGAGLIREGNAAEYLDVARQVLSRILDGAPRGLPLGLASQRSSFLLWDRESGAARTPMISWQDRRAADWCIAHADLEEQVRSVTGLVLSPHYAGPKLAMLLADDGDLRRQVEAGRLRFGTLDAWALQNWTAARPHETDATMAARTVMFDLSTGDWSGSLLAAYGIERDLLPRVEPTTGRAIELFDGTRVTATISDQAAGVHGALGDATDAILITLGTGGFVLRPLDQSATRAGYLTAPVLGSRAGVERLALEGSINGVATALAAHRLAAPPSHGLDRSPSAFCIPDSAGLGSPFWRPRVGLQFSCGAQELSEPERGWVVIEGLLFRLRQILEDLAQAETVTANRPRILLSGGIAERPGVVEGLAAVLGRPVELLLEREAGLVGAAWLALGQKPHENPATRTVEPTAGLAYLKQKYVPWSTWMLARLADEA